MGRLRPDAPAILAVVKDWTRVNYDEPLEVQARRWSRTPVFLVGDAAHAMTPYLGDLATLRWAPARWPRDRLLPVLGSAGRLEHRAALVTAGFNRAEQELLSLGP